MSENSSAFYCRAGGIMQKCSQELVLWDGFVYGAHILLLHSFVGVEFLNEILPRQQSYQAQYQGAIPLHRRTRKESAKQ